MRMALHQQLQSAYHHLGSKDLIRRRSILRGGTHVSRFLLRNGLQRDAHDIRSIRRGQTRPAHRGQEHKSPLQRGQVDIPTLVFHAAAKVRDRETRRDRVGVLQGEEQLQGGSHRHRHLQRHSRKGAPGEDRLTICGTYTHA